MRVVRLIAWTVLPAPRVNHGLVQTYGERDNGTRSLDGVVAVSKVFVATVRPPPTASRTMRGSLTAGPARRLDLTHRFPFGPAEADR